MDTSLRRASRGRSCRATRCSGTRPRLRRKLAFASASAGGAVAASGAGISRSSAFFRECVVSATRRTAAPTPARHRGCSTRRARRMRRAGWAIWPSGGRWPVPSRWPAHILRKPDAGPRAPFAHCGRGPAAAAVAVPRLGWTLRDCCCTMAATRAQTSFTRGVTPLHDKAVREEGRLCRHSSRRSGVRPWCVRRATVCTGGGGARGHRCRGQDARRRGAVGHGRRRGRSDRPPTEAAHLLTIVHRRARTCICVHMHTIC